MEKRGFQIKPFIHYARSDTGIFWESAKKHVEKSIAYCEETKFHSVLANALCASGSIYSFLGSPEAGKRRATKGFEMYHESGNKMFLSYWQWATGGIYLDLGDLENARVSMEEALRLSVKNHEKGWEGLAWTGLGRVRGKQKAGDMGNVKECFLKGLEILDLQGLRPAYALGCLFLGEFFLDQGQEEKALENLRQAELMFQEMGMGYWLNKTRKAQPSL